MFLDGGARVDAAGPLSAEEVLLARVEALEGANVALRDEVDSQRAAADAVATPGMPGGRPRLA